MTDTDTYPTLCTGCERFMYESKDSGPCPICFPASVKIELTPDEIGLLIDALDSYEYWEHRDLLPHGSGFITVMDDEDFERQVVLGGGDQDEIDAAVEAWQCVKEARKLTDRLRREK